MAGLLLAAEDRAHFLALMRRQLNSAVHRRINALLLLDDGWTAERVCEALFIDADTVRAHKQRFLASGRAGVERLDYAGHAPVLTEAQALAAELASRFCQTAKEVCGFVAARFGLGYTPNAMAKLLNRLVFVWKQPKRVPPTAAGGRQHACLPEVRAPFRAGADADADQPLYFVDATHPAYDAHPAQAWLRRGGTRELRSNHGRANVTLNGALHWPSRAVVTREAGKITAAEMIALFEDLARRHPTASAVNVVLDNATYNRAIAVREWLATPGCTVRLVFLPPYAPNLNLIERLWWLLKKTTLWNTHYPTFAEFRAAIYGFFANLPDMAGQLASLLTSNFQPFCDVLCGSSPESLKVVKTEMRGVSTAVYARQPMAPGTSLP